MVTEEQTNDRLWDRVSGRPVTPIFESEVQVSLCFSEHKFTDQRSPNFLENSVNSFLSLFYLRGRGFVEIDVLYDVYFGLTVYRGFLRITYWFPI